MARGVAMKEANGIQAGPVGGRFSFEQDEQPASARLWLPSLRIVLVYAITSGLWIALSDLVVARVVSPAHIHHVQTAKGWFFVTATSVLLFFLIRRSLDTIRRSTAADAANSNLLKAIFESSAMGLAVFDPDMRFVEVNTSFARLLGYHPSEMRGLRSIDVTVPEDRVATEEGFRSLIDGEVAHASIEKRYVHKQGGAIWCSAHAAPLRGPQGDVVGVVTAIKDVRRRKEREQTLLDTVEALRASDRERRLLLSALLKAEEAERQRLAADVHDDTLQVLTGAVMRLDLEAKKSASMETAHSLGQLSEDLRAGMRRLRSLVFELRPVALDQGRLAEALDRYLSEASTRDPVRHEIEDLTVERMSPPVRQTAYRVAREALSNALKHSGATVIKVCVAPDGGGIRLTISDDGRGFDVAAVTSAAGRNLGLPLMEEKTRLIGGWLRFDSRPGVGTTVDFWLPDRSDEQLRSERDEEKSPA